MNRLVIMSLLATTTFYGAHPATVAIPREPEWCLQHHQALNAKAKRGGFEVLLLGDSITWEWEANPETGALVWPELASLKAATFGVSGDRTEHLLWRLQNGNLDFSAAPRAAVLMIGTNNLGQRNDPPDAIAEGVRAILNVIKSRFPDCALYVYGIFPRGKAANGGLRKEVNATNRLLEKVASDQGASYVDIGPQFLMPDGTLNDRCYRDGVHLSRDGYEVWAKSLLKELKN